MNRWPALLTPDEAAEYLSVSRKTVERLKADGQLLTVQLPGREVYRFRLADLDSFIARLEYGNAQPPACVIEGRR